MAGLIALYLGSTALPAQGPVIGGCPILVQGSDFEVVDVSSLLIDPDSGQAQPSIFTDGFESGDTGAWSQTNREDW